MKNTRVALFSVLVAAALAAACSKQPAQGGAPGAAQAPPPNAASGDPTLAKSHAAEPATPPTPEAAASKPTPIADVWADRKTLAGKTVTVHGKVVKYNGGIMGKNWIHIQDGTGKADDRTNDLTVTSSDETQVGDEVTVVGVVGVDRDFTAGYQYPVMLENARILKK